MLNRLRSYWPILIPIGIYAVLLFIPWVRDALLRGDLFSSITIFMGWIVALLTAAIHLDKIRKDNQRLKKEEIRRSLKIDAFRKINEAVTNFGSVLVKVSNKYLWWPFDLKNHREDPRYHKFDKAKIELETVRQNSDLVGGEAEFILAIEGNEIAVIQFDHLRKYIQFKVDDARELIMEFSKYLMSTKREILLTEPRYLDFKKKCMKIRDELMSIQSYLFDYRIELMNSMLGEIFDSQVPFRKPRDPKCKTLTEVAIKEEVEKEAERRELEALEQGRRKKHSSPEGTANQ